MTRISSPAEQSLHEPTHRFEQAQLAARKARVGLHIELEHLLRTANDPDVGQDSMSIALQGFAVVGALEDVSDHLTVMDEVLATRREIAGLYES